MADSIEKDIILKISLDNSQITNKLNESTDSLNKLLDKQKQMSVENKKGTVEWYTNQQAISLAKKEVTSLAKALELNAQKTKENSSENKNSITSLLAMKQEVKNLMIQMDAAAKMGDAITYKNLEKELATLKNDIKDTVSAMKYLDPGELLSGWVKTTEGIAGSLAAITGGMALFGADAETVNEIQKKSTVIIQTLIGLEKARQLLIDSGGRKELQTLITTTAQQLKKIFVIETVTAVTEGEAVATEGATVAQKALNVAMKANPIGIIITALVALTGVIIALVASEDDATEAAKEHAQALQDVKDVTNDYFSAVIKLNELHGESQKTIDDLKRKQAEYNVTLARQAIILAQLDDDEEKEVEAKKQLGSALKAQFDVLASIIEKNKELKKQKEDELKDKYLQRKQQEYDALLKVQKAEEDEKEAQKKWAEEQGKINNQKIEDNKNLYNTLLNTVNNYYKTDEERQLEALEKEEQNAMQLLAIHNASEEQITATAQYFNDRRAEISANSNQKISDDFVASQKKQEQAFADGVKNYQDMISIVNSGIEDFYSGQDVTFRNAARNLILLALDVLKAQVEMAEVGATVQSIATFGPAGALAAAPKILAIEAAFAAVKGAVQAMIPKAEKGIILGGRSHAQGGDVISVDGRPVAIAEKGELLTIVNKKSTSMLQSLSNLNQAGGGIPFMAKGGIPKYQSGGIPSVSINTELFDLIKNLPHPIVAVENIIDAVSRNVEVKNKANI